MSDTRLALVRHGQTDWNAQRRIQGATDIPLNDIGRSQALEAAERLADGRWDGILASPLTRAADTANIIADTLGLERPTLVPALIERSYGQLEGLTREQRMARFSPSDPVPGLESRTAVADRVMAALEGLAGATPAGRRLIVVTHGGVIGSVLRRISDGTLPRAGELIPNGSHHILARGDDRAWRVESLNTVPGDPEYRPIP